MKKSLITLALGVALAACSHDYDYKPGEDNNKLVPINLTAQVNAITRAVNSGVINTPTLNLRMPESPAGRRKMAK